MNKLLPNKFHDYRWFSERFLSIRDRSGNIIPYKMNDLQEKLHEDLSGSDDVLKARKGGVSTDTALRMVHLALTRANFRGLILAHDHTSSISIFDIVKTAHKHLPQELKPKLDIDSRQEIGFAGLDSKISAHTASNLEIGRGGTIDFLHCSEIAFWDDAHSTLTAVQASLGDDAIIVRESTANGAGNYWHREWIKQKNRESIFKGHFFPWWVESRYSVETPDPIKDAEEFDSDMRPLWKSDPNLEFKMNDEEAQLAVANGLLPPQIRWRRRQMKSFGAKFPQEYAEDDVTCFLTSGRGVFNNKMLSKVYGNLSTNKPVREVEELGLKVWVEFPPDAQMTVEYVIGADTAEGIADETDPRKAGDFSAASIIEKRSGVQVATVHGNWEPYEFAHVLYKVGHQFATPSGGLPLIGVERNEYGHATLNELHNHLEYGNLYREEVYDAEKLKMTSKLGWRTSKESRPIMITDLVKAVNGRTLGFLDPEFVAECLTFSKTKRGRAEAQSGCKDDRVMAAAIAWQMKLAYQSVPLDGVNFG